MTPPPNFGYPGFANTMSSFNVITSTATRSSDRSRSSTASSSARSSLGRRSMSALKAPARWIKTKSAVQSSKQSIKSFDSEDEDEKAAHETKQAEKSPFLRIFGTNRQVSDDEARAKKEAKNKEREQRRARLEDYRTFERADYWMGYCIL